MWLIGMIAFVQFALSALQNVPQNWLMFWLWLVGGSFVTTATIRIEMYFTGRRRVPDDGR